MKVNAILWPVEFIKTVLCYVWLFHLQQDAKQIKQTTFKLNHRMVLLLLILLDLIELNWKVEQGGQHHRKLRFC